MRCRGYLRASIRILRWIDDKTGTERSKKTGYIDEGFGTLDEQYLDTAMKALETLKSANKTIAIISHVEKLKEYIPAGIEVIKETTGSTVKMKDIY